MVLFAWRSCIRFVPMPLTLICTTMMKGIVQDILIQLSSFWNQSGYWLQLIWVVILAYDQISIKKSVWKGIFAGVIEVNCNQFILYDTMTKKNTQIDRLSVLSAVCDYHLNYCIQIVACCRNMINIFESCYV